MTGESESGWAGIVFSVPAHVLAIRRGARKKVGGGVPLDGEGPAGGGRGFKLDGNVMADA